MKLNDKLIKVPNTLNKSNDTSTLTKVELTRVSSIEVARNRSKAYAYLF